MLFRSESNEEAVARGQVQSLGMDLGARVRGVARRSEDRKEPTSCASWERSYQDMSHCFALPFLHQTRAQVSCQRSFPRRPALPGNMSLMLPGGNMVTCFSHGDMSLYFPALIRGTFHIYSRVFSGKISSQQDGRRHYLVGCSLRW